MAKLMSTRRTPWVRGPTAVIDAMQIGAVSDKHDVYFERVVAYKSFLKQGAQAIIDPLGATIDAVLDSGLAIGASFAQDVGTNGLLVNSIDFTIEIAATNEGGDVTDTVTVSMQSIFDGGAAGVESELQAVEAALRGATGL